MQFTDTAIMTIEGKAEADVFIKLSKEYNLTENQRWVFVDYSIATIPINTVFDTLLEGDSKSLVPGIFVIKVLECLDQFGNTLSEIPEGWKTICKLEFYPEVPSKIENLPSMTGWQFNPNRITLANHKDIKLNYSGSDTSFKDVSSFAYLLLTSYLLKSESNVTTVTEFYSYLERTFLIDHNKADNILTVFVQTGKIKPINDDRIELLSAV